METIAECQTSQPRVGDQHGSVLRCRCGNSFVESGDSLLCDSCGTQFEFRQGILCARSLAYSTDEISKVQDQEERTRDQQARYYDAWLALHFPSWLEGRRIKKAVDRVPGSAALEVGCGTGRLTAHLAKRFDSVVAVDRSFQSLTLCRERLKDAGLVDRTLLVHADLSEIPVKGASFSIAVMAQVLQHLPTPEIRSNTMAEISRFLSPQGQFIMSAYEWNPLGAFGRKKVGYHAGGIYYHRFTKSELVALMEPHLEVHDVRSCFGQLLVSVSTKPA